MRNIIMMLIGTLGFIYLVGSMGKYGFGDISLLSLIIRSIISLVVIFVSTIVFCNDDFWKAVKKYWRMKKRWRIKSKRF